MNETHLEFKTANQLLSQVNWFENGLKSLSGLVEVEHVNHPLYVDVSEETRTQLLLYSPSVFQTVRKSLERHISTTHPLIYRF